MGEAPRYADLQIRIHALRNQAYPVELTLERELEYGPGSLSTSELPWKSSGDPFADGRRLFEWLFADPRLRASWNEIRGRHPQRRLRFRIAATAPEIHAVPWELLCDVDSATVQHLAATQATPFSRYLAGKWQPGAAIIKRPLQVLAVVANPAGLDEYGLQAVDVETEAALLRQATQDLDVELHFLPAPCTLSAIENALRDGSYHALHFFAHGAFDPEAQSAALFLEDSQRDVYLAVDEEVASMLARQLADLDTQRQDKLRLVFLESCQTATRSPADAFRGFAPRLVAAGVPAVVAMQEKVPVVTAREFAETFYRRLLEHGQVDLATNEARSAILTGKLPGAAIPVLFQRLRSGRLLAEPSADAAEVLDELGTGPYKAPSKSEFAATDVRTEKSALDDAVPRETVRLDAVPDEPAFQDRLPGNTIPQNQQDLDSDQQSLDEDQQSLDELDEMVLDALRTNRPTAPEPPPDEPPPDERPADPDVPQSAGGPASPAHPRPERGGPINRRPMVWLAVAAAVIVAIFVIRSLRSDRPRPSTPITEAATRQQTPLSSESSPDGSKTEERQEETDPKEGLPEEEDDRAEPAPPKDTPTKTPDTEKAPEKTPEDPKRLDEPPGEEEPPAGKEREKEAPKEPDGPTPPLEAESSEAEGKEPVEAEGQPEGPKVALMPLGLGPESEGVARQLADQATGKLVWDIFQDLLVRKSAITLVAISKEIDPSIDQQWIRMGGIVSPEAASVYGKRSGARHVVYGGVDELSFTKTGRQRWEATMETRLLVLRDLDDPVPESFESTVTLTCKVSFDDELAFAQSSIAYLTATTLKLAGCDLMRSFPDWAKPGALNDCVLMAPSGCEVR